MWPLIGGLMSGAASLFGGMMTNQQSAQNVAAQNAAQMQQTQQQEAFQERMSDTAYQRAAADMQKAGLNPMMMFGGGSAASTPSGSAAQIARPEYQSPLSSIGNTINNTVSNAVSMKTLDKMTDEMANLRSQNLLTQAQTETEKERPFAVDAQANKDVIQKALLQAGLPEADVSAKSSQFILDFITAHPEVARSMVLAKTGAEGAGSILGSFFGGNSARGIRDLMKGW